MNPAIADATAEQAPVAASGVLSVYANDYKNLYILFGNKKTNQNTTKAATTRHTPNRGVILTFVILLN
jgi:hypothetical protein